MYSEISSDEEKNLPEFDELSGIFINEDKCFEFLSSHVFPSVNQCRNCGGIMRLMQNKRIIDAAKKIAK